LRDLPIIAMSAFDEQAKDRVSSAQRCRVPLCVQV
jgi:hypothetical protein